MSRGHTRGDGSSSRAEQIDEKFTEHHTIPAARGGSLQDVIWVLGARHRRWHTIFREATPKDAIVRLEHYYTQFFPSEKQKEALRTSSKSDQHKARIEKQIAIRQEAWKYLFGEKSIADVRAAILRDWTVEGTSVYEAHRIPTCQCYLNGRHKHKQGCTRPRPRIPSLRVLATVS